MESEVMKKFNKELASIHDIKPPLSKAKIKDITSAALKAKSLYKHVVFSVEKFLGKCKTEHRLYVLYIMDSIIRASKHQFKEKDVYASRFLKNFEKSLGVFLSCSPPEQARVVRVLNLWTANGVFSNEEIDPFRQQCQSMGINTDCEAVEKQVKGKNADMKIYGGAYIKKEKSGKKDDPSTTPPGPPPSSLMIPKTIIAQLSNEAPPGAISEKELLTIMREFNCDPSGLFSTDLDLFKKAYSTFVRTISGEVTRRQEVAAQTRAMRPGNIKSVLTSQFGDYSDDEEEPKTETEPIEDSAEQMSHETILELARGIMSNETVSGALEHMKQLYLEEKAAEQQKQQQQQQQQQQMQQNIPQNLAGLLPAMGMQYGNLPQGISLAQFAGAQGGLQPQPNLLGMIGSNPLLQGMIPQHLQQGIGGVQQGIGGVQQGIGGVQQGIGGVQQGIGGQQSLTGLVRPPNMDLSNHQKEILQHLAAGKLTMNLQPNLAGLQGTPQKDQMMNLQNLGQQQYSMERDHSFGGNDSRRDQKENSQDRERKKSGLPAVTPGIAFVASCTLWFGRLPPNASEADLKAAVADAGVPTRIKIINTRACAYVTMDTRRAAYQVVSRQPRDVIVARKQVKVSWANGSGTNEPPYNEMWNIEKGVVSIPWDRLPNDLERLCEGSILDVESLPNEKKPLYSERGVFSIPSASFGIDKQSSSRGPPNFPPGFPPTHQMPPTHQLPPQHQMPPQHQVPPQFQLGGLPMQPPPPHNMGGRFPPGMPPPPNFAMGMPPPGMPPPGMPPPQKPQQQQHLQLMPPGIQNLQPNFGGIQPPNMGMMHDKPPVFHQAPPPGIPQVNAFRNHPPQGMERMRNPFEVADEFERSYREEKDGGRRRDRSRDRDREFRNRDRHRDRDGKRDRSRERHRDDERGDRSERRRSRWDGDDKEKEKDRSRDGRRKDGKDKDKKKKRKHERSTPDRDETDAEGRVERTGNVDENTVTSTTLDDVRKEAPTSEEMAETNKLADEFAQSGDVEIDNDDSMDIE